MAKSSPTQTTNQATHAGLGIAFPKDTKFLGMNSSQVRTSSLPASVCHAPDCGWQKEHQDFIAAYNHIVDKEGLPLEVWREF